MKHTSFNFVLGLFLLIDWGYSNGIIDALKIFDFILLIFLGYKADTAIGDLQEKDKEYG